MSARSTAFKDLVFALLVGCIAPVAWAELNHEIVGIPDEVSAGSNAYHTSFYYEILIDRPAALIWPHLIQQSTWIESDFEPVSGVPGQVGNIQRLYAGQQFYMQTLKVIPEKLLLQVNLPSLYRDEYSTGVGIFTLHPVCPNARCNSTRLSVIMDRRYVWQGEGHNGTRDVRGSVDFNEATRVAWEDNYLPRLKSLAEAESVDAAVRN